MEKNDKYTCKVSVIVPVYNTEKYLEECLNSIINQTLREIEIIVINDGSKDNSLEIVEKFAQSDKRIRIVDQENGGLSSARNRGLEISRGEYISFVDSDDYIDPEMLEIMYKAGKEKNLDMVLSGYKKILGSRTVTCKNPLETEKIFSREEKKEIIIKTHESNIIWFVWRNLYSSRILKENGIKFLENLKLGEDSLFNLHAFQKSENIMALDGCFYNYRDNPESLTQKYRPGLLEELEHQYTEKKKFYKEYGLLEEAEEGLRKNLIKHLLPMCIGNFYRNRERVQSIKKIMDYAFIREIIEDLNYGFLLDGNYTLKNKIIVFLIKIKAFKIIDIIYA